MDGLRFAVAINRSYRGKPPADASLEFWREFNGRFRNEYLSADELAESIQAGFACTTHHQRYRKADNFIQGQHVGLDMDTMDHRSTIEALARDPFIGRHAALIHTTPSHRPEAPRARVIFLLDRPIRRRDKQALLAQALVSRYGVADEKCKDPCRIFYGAEGCEIALLGNVLTLKAAAEHLVNPYKRALADEKRRREREWAAAEVRRGEASETLLARYVDQAVQAEFERLAHLGRGSRHNTLLEAALALGGLLKASWVPRDLLDEARIYATLERACQRNKLWEEDGAQSVRTTIRDGINYAEPRKEPLWKPRDEPAGEPSTVLPEIVLTPEQVAREREAIARIRAEGWWEGFHAGMTAGQRMVWESLGIPASAIDRYELGFREDREALTIPYLHAGQLVNIEYHSLTSGGVSYESEAPTLFEAHDHDAPCLLLDDALTAIQTMTAAERRLPQLAARYSVMGLPRIPLRPDSFRSLGDRPAIALLGPMVDDEQIRTLRRRAKVLRLPLVLGEMINLGLDGDKLRWCVRQAA